MRPSSSSITTIAIAFALALAGCGGPAKAPGPPAPDETPPTTKDPGAVEDEPPLQPAPPPIPETGGGGSVSGADPRGRPDGATCLAAADCASGICEGEGCTDDRPGRCAPKSRACTRDLRQYCGCDGQTFGASGSCPGRRYAATGTCK
jgi:hypothetical protein